MDTVLERFVIFLFSFNSSLLFFLNKKPSHLDITSSFMMLDLTIKIFSKLCNEVWIEPYNYPVIDISKNKNFNFKSQINWGWRVFVV